MTCLVFLRYFKIWRAFLLLVLEQVYICVCDSNYCNREGNVENGGYGETGGFGGNGEHGIYFGGNGTNGTNDKPTLGL